MAKFIPSLEKIQQFKVQPTQGEWALLHFLREALDDTFEVYFNPYLNGDRPDIIILKKHGGVFIVEVKDWDLDLYKLDKKKHWHLAHPKDANERRTTTLSPIDQCLKYKENLFEIHIEGLLEKNIRNKKLWGVVTCGVYFHNANQKKVDDLILSAYSTKNDKSFIRHIELIGCDGLERTSFLKRLNKHHMLFGNNELFDDNLYESVHHLLLPPLHMKNQGTFISRYDARLKKRSPDLFMYSKKQDELIFDKQKRQQWRVKGVVGSGKTTLLAAKAVQAYKELILSGVEDPKILILTFNITLKNFIHDKLQKVNEDFNWNAFTISNYHEFIKSQLLNLGIKILLDKDDPNNEDFEIYFSNYDLFTPYKDITNRFDVIFIDEIQDYKRVWMDIIKDFFLFKGGSYPRSGYYLLGDVKQNIYNMTLSHKDVVTNVQGVHTLDSCFRSDKKIKDLALGFQRKFFSEKYEIDSTLFSDEDSLFDRKNLQQGIINYEFIQENDNDLVKKVFDIVHNIINHELIDVALNDVTILGTEIDFLRLIDTFFRCKDNYKTSTMFETYETMFSSGLTDLHYPEIQAIIDKIKPLIKYHRSQIYAAMSNIFVVYDLYLDYPSLFKNQLIHRCNTYGVNYEEFLSIIDELKNEYLFFKDKIIHRNYKKIRRNKKYNFWMNSGRIKISTVHSFKGWESDSIFLLLSKKKSSKESLEELIYTGLTRARSNLFIINLGNKTYHENLKELVDAYK